MISDDELYNKYSKLVYFVIHRWSTKPSNYKEYIEDLASSVWIRLFSISKYGSRRNNSSYINTTIQRTLSQEFSKLRSINHNEALDITDTNDYSEEDSDDNVRTNELKMILENIIEKSFNLDERIVITAYLQLGYNRNCNSIPAISRMIFKSKEETKSILDSALSKLEAAL